MAFVFLLPRFIWHAGPRHSGVNIKRLVYTIKEKNEDDKGIKLTQVTLKLYLDAQYETRKNLCCPRPVSKCTFGYTIGYIAIKIIYIVNCVIQYYFLYNFLAIESIGDTFEALTMIYTSETSAESPKFPRVTMCDFMVRRLGANQHWYSVQCNLPFNMYNEKIFLGIWFWLIILTGLNVLSIVVLGVLLSPCIRLSTISKYLNISVVVAKEVRTYTLTTTTGGYNSTMNEETLKFTTAQGERTTKTGNENRTITTRQEERKVNEPVESREIDERGKERFLEYLGYDGYLFFLLIARNTDEITAAKIIKYLYDKQPLGPRTRDSQV